MEKVEDIKFANFSIEQILFQGLEVFWVGGMTQRGVSTFLRD